MDFHNHNEAVINIKGEEPLYCVNNTNVVSQSGTFYESNQFSEYLAGHKLETVFIPESLLTSSKDSFGLMVKDIPSPCFNDYHIVLKSFYDVLLKPKNSLCHYSVMVDPTTWHDEKKLETASKLGALLAYEIPVLKKRKEMKDYIIDVRFKNRIYARKAQPLSFELGAKGGGKNELKHNT